MFGTAWALAIALTLQASGTGAPSPPKPPEQAKDKAWTDDRPLTHFFPNLLKDIRALPSKDTVVWLAAGGAGALAVHGADQPFADWSARSGESEFAQAGHHVGDGWVQSGGAVATYVVGKLAKKPQVAHIGSDLIRAQALNGLLTTAIKVSVDRTRPNGGRYAFPSGHTSATFTSATVIHAHYGWKAGGPAFGVASIVGWGRVRDRKHWLSDVAFGAAVGIISGRTVTMTHGSRKVTMVPTVTKGGAALTFFVLPR